MTEGTGSAPLIAVVSGVANAMSPARSALESELPDAIVWNLLDDRLIDDAERAGGMTADLRQRFLRLIGHAVAEGAEAALVTCSLYSLVAENATTASFPVVSSDLAAFDAALQLHPARILLVGTVPVALEDSGARLRTHLGRRGSTAAVLAIPAVDAFTPSRAGDQEATVDAIVAALPPAADGDVLLLAQFSTDLAAPGLRTVIPMPVITPPAAAAAAVRTALSPIRS